MLVYPTAASWFSAWSHDTDVDGYVSSVDQIPAHEITDLLSASAFFAWANRLMLSLGDPSLPDAA